MLSLTGRLMLTWVEQMIINNKLKVRESSTFSNQLYSLNPGNREKKIHRGGILLPEETDV